MIRLDAPIAFLPLLRERVWGGDWLKSRVEHPPAGPVGESWELSDVADAFSPLVRDPGDLRELVHIHGSAIVGEAWDPSLPGRFPLLVKLLETRQVLSLQVHPDDERAGRLGGSAAGKTEAWYILGAESGSYVHLGLAPGVDRQRLEAALAAGDVESCLRKVHPAPGDAIFVPAGTIHAIGPGLRLIEIQQSSDTTFRLFDWNRPGIDGNPRRLHVESALAVAHFGAADAPAARPELVPVAGAAKRILVDHEKFRIEEYSLFDPSVRVSFDTERRRFAVVIVVAGRAHVGTRGGELERGPLDLALVPAAAGPWTLTASREAVVLVVTKVAPSPRES